MTKSIRVAIVGVGNCASSLVQGIHHYRNSDQNNIPGIMYPNIGGYLPKDIEFVAAFDVDERKVGKPLGEAIFAKPNCARVFNPNVPSGPIVKMGSIEDGVSDYMLNQPENYGFRVSGESTPFLEVVNALKDAKVDVLLNYLPVGSQKGTEFYANAAIAAGVGFINCIPVLSINSPEWEKKFIDAGIAYIGSDMKSQFGASIFSQMIQELAFDRGMVVDFHQQLNVGGNTDFNNMMVQSRLKNKKVSKENVIRAQNDIRNIPVDEEALFAGPSTFIPYLKDNKVAYFNVRLRGFGDAEVTVDVKLSVQDSENSAGVVVDAIRFLKVASEIGIMGCVRGPSSFTQKSPPKQMTHEDSKFECSELAERRLTKNTMRQTNKEEAVKFALEEFESGGMDYLRLIDK